MKTLHILGHSEVALGDRVNKQGLWEVGFEVG